jgi:hypothetical protein
MTLFRHSMMARMDAVTSKAAALWMTSTKGEHLGP